MVDRPDQNLVFSITSEGQVALKAVRESLDAVEKSVKTANRALDEAGRALKKQSEEAANTAQAYTRSKERVVETARGLREATTNATAFTREAQRGADALRQQAEFARAVTRRSAVQSSGGGAGGGIGGIGGAGGTDDGSYRDAAGRLRDQRGRFIGGLGDLNGDAREATVSTIALGNAIAILSLGVAKLGINIAASGLSTFVDAAGSMVGVLGDVTQGVTKATEQFEKFSITIEGALKSAERAKQISGFVQEFALRTPQRVEDLQDLVKSLSLIPALKPQFFGDFDQVKVRLEDIFNTVIGLASLDPSQGIPGAVFALREALSGQFRSLQARFEILPAVVAGSIGKTVAEIKRSPPLVIAALKQFVEDSVGPQTIAKLGALPSVRIGNILEGLTSIAPRQIGQTGVSRLVGEVLGAVDDEFQTFLRAGGPFEQRFAPRLGDALQRSLLAGVRVAISVGRAAGLNLENGSPLDAAASGIAGGLERVATLVEKFAARLETEEGSTALKSTLSNLLEALESFYNGLTSFVQALPALLPLMSNFVRIMAGLVESTFGALASLSDRIEDFVLNNPSIGTALFGPTFGKEAERIGAKRELASVLSGTRPVSSFDEIAVREREQRLIGQQSGLSASPIPGLSAALIEASKQAINQSQLREVAAGSGGDAKRFVESARAAGLNLDPKTAAQLVGGPADEAVRRIRQYADNFDRVQASAEKLAQDVSTNRPLATLFLGKEIGLFGADERSQDERSSALLKSALDTGRESIRTSVATLRTTALEARDQLEKSLLTPLEIAAKKAEETRGIFETSIAALDSALQSGLIDVSKAEREAFLALDSVFDVERAQGFAKRADEARAALVKFFRDTKSESEALRSSADAQNFIVVLKDLFGADPRNLDQLTTRLGAVRGSLQAQRPALFGAPSLIGDGVRQDLQSVLARAGIDPLARTPFGARTQGLFEGQLTPERVSGLRALVDELLGDNTRLKVELVPTETLERLRASLEFVGSGFRTLGTEQAKQLAGLSLGIGRANAEDDATGFGAFGRGTAGQIAGQERGLEILRSSSEAQERINALLREANVSEADRAAFQTAVAEGLAKELGERQKALNILIAQKAVEDDERKFQRGLGRVEFDVDRLSAINQRAAELQDRLAADDGALAGFLGVGGDPRAGAIAAGYREALKQDLLELGDQAQDLERTLERQRREFDRRRSLNGPAGKIAQSLDLFGEDQFGRQSLKTQDELFVEAGASAAVGFVGGFKTAIGDSLYSVFKGNFDGIAEAWAALNDSILRIFADTLADLAVRSTALSFFQNVLGFGSVAAGAGGPLGSVGAGNEVTPGLRGQLAMGGNTMTWGGSYTLGAGPGGIANGPQYIMVGEGGRPELVAPLDHFGRLPATMTGNGIAASLPGGRTVPLSMQRGPRYTAGFQQAPQMPDFAAAGGGSRPVYVVNLVDAAQITRLGLASSGDVVINQVAGNIRNSGQVARAILAAP